MNGVKKSAKSEPCVTALLFVEYFWHQLVVCGVFLAKASKNHECNKGVRKSFVFVETVNHMFLNHAFVNHISLWRPVGFIYLQQVVKNCCSCC